jgi:hypothetical protein
MVRMTSWGMCGDDDDLGRLKLITPRADKRGCDEIRHDLVISLVTNRSGECIHLDLLDTSVDCQVRHIDLPPRGPRAVL